MQLLPTVRALSGVCVLTSVAVLCSLAMGSPASEQMAAKRKISLHLHQDIEQCQHFDAATAQACERQAWREAEVAKAELGLRRQVRQAQVDRRFSAWPARERS